MTFNASKWCDRLSRDIPTFLFNRGLIPLRWVVDEYLENVTTIYFQSPVIFYIGPGSPFSERGEQLSFCIDFRLPFISQGRLDYLVAKAFDDQFDDEWDEWLPSIALEDH